ncbi:unnamed protein product [Fraxinus pennsylvanica]|uniref:NAC domain-containing protein n=1 Tax=Fraxinus pennsylvanica TaxID=56036 RepID=A0AAD2A1A5_9LAMI|nr:unnamed protein product [Fraxinus pennsylvanica]
MESKPIQTETASLTSLIHNIIPTTYNTDDSYDDYFSWLTDDEYFGSLPPGFRFVPSEDELIHEYLNKKIRNEKLPPNKINVLNLYEFNPEQLANYTPARENEWYFFTPRKRKYKNGQRPNRGADKGYWKATGADRQIKRNGEVIGYQKALVFYEGKPPNGIKTTWIMQEYRVSNPPPLQRKGEDDMRLDDWVLCKVYNKEGKPKGTRKRARINKNQIQESNNNTDQAAAMQEKTDHALAVHSAAPYNFKYYQNPNNLVYPDVHVVPTYQNANMCSNLAPITTVSPMPSLVPDHSRHVAVSMEQHHEISRMPTMDINEFLDMECILNLENQPHDYSLLF